MSDFNPKIHRAIFSTGTRLKDMEWMWWPNVLAGLFNELGFFDIHIGPQPPADITRLWFLPDENNQRGGSFLAYSSGSWRAMVPDQLRAYMGRTRCTAGVDGEAFQGGTLFNNGRGVRFTTPGSYAFTVPDHVTSLDVVVVGGGGPSGYYYDWGGGWAGGGGGGAGGQAQKQIPTQPGDIFSLVVPNESQTASFGTELSATGGAGGLNAREDLVPGTAGTGGFGVGGDTNWTGGDGQDGLKLDGYTSGVGTGAAGQTSGPIASGSGYGDGRETGLVQIKWNEGCGA